MRVLAAAFVLSLVAAASGNPSGTAPQPPVPNCYLEGYYQLPHPQCDKFWVCRNHNLSVGTCPTGLLFNADLQSCDYPANCNTSNCDLPTQPPTSTTQHPTTPVYPTTDRPATTTEKVTTVPTITYRPTTSATKPHYTTTVRPTTSTTRPTTSHTVRPTTSTTRPTTPATLPPTTVDPKTPSCDKPGVYYVPHEYCDQYWTCAHGDAIEGQCSPGLYWNQAQGSCDFASNVDTSDCKEPTPAPTSTTRPPTTTPEWTTRPSTQPPTTVDPNKPECKEPGVYGLPSEYCNKYWMCVEGEAYEQSCSNGLYWNGEKGSCDYPFNVDTSNCIEPTSPPHSSTRPPHTTTTEQTTTVPTTPERTTTIRTTTTPEQTTPERTTTVSTTPERTTTVRTTTTPERTTTVPTTPERTTTVRTTTTPERTTTVRTTTTPERTTTVRTTTTPERTTTPSPLTTIYPVQCEPTGDYYIPGEMCNEFWRCVNGIPYLSECSPGLVWNQQSSVCDYPENVDTSDCIMP